VNDSSVARTRQLTRATSVVVSCILSAQAMAQEQGSSSALDEIAEVAVTGTRISGFTAPTPVTSVGIEELQTKAVRNVADLMQDIPALRVNFNTGQVSAPLGSSNLDLRGLGGNRTLLLLDGRRFGSTDATGGVDVNVIPTVLIRKIDIVTGGASAAYGSDAVSGVVNMFLDNEFEGLKTDVQYGQSRYDDIRQTGASIGFGKSLFGGRLHFVTAGDYTKNTGQASQASRPWGRNNVAILNNPAYAPGNGQAQRLILPDSLLSQMTYGGVTAVNSNPALRGLEFLPGGVVRPFAYGTNVGSTFMTGGGGISIIGDANILPELERGSGYAHVDFELNDSAKLYADALYSHATAFADQLYNTDTGNLTIRRDNAFLPQSVRNIMVANNLQTFQMGRLDTEAGVFNTDVTTKVQRYALGAEGTMFDGWNWDVYAQFGRNSYNRLDNNNRITANYANAVDSVINPATGQPVCRSTLTNPGNGCVPANVFGQGSIGAAAVAYYTGTSWLNQEQEQDVYAFKIDGTPFRTWAGPVATAFGAEYRTESIVIDSDPISQASGWRQINAQALDGSYKVKEGFLEVGVPLLNELPMAYLLDLNGAVRRTDYSTSGGVTTWKVGLNYEPIETLRVRGTLSRDIRAPNINELFSGQNQGISPLIDPVNNTQRSVVQLTGGNPNLTPERALSYTFGAVYRPGWAPGLRMSADYYSIDLDDAISALTPQQVVDGCYRLGQQSLCSQLTRDATGVLTKVEATLLNTASTQTSGLDLEVGYVHDLAPGQLSIRMLTTYVDKLVTTVSGVPTDRAGQVGATGGVPHWRGNVSTEFRTQKYNAGILYRYVQGGTYDNTFVQGIDINDNTVSARGYVDLSGGYKITDNVEVFGKINNLLDADPPATPNIIAQTIYASSPFYDRTGRYYIGGVRARF
jgi:outer membrane receptor protein involved in Fe transport